MTSISTPARFTSTMRNPARGRSSSRRGRWGFWKTCPVGRTVLGSFRATTGADASATAVSTMLGGPCGPQPGWRTSGCATAEHTFASRALALGGTLPVIGRLLGHSDIETTARCAYLAHDSIHETAERIAQSIAADFP